MLSSEVEEKLIEFLAIIYLNVQWSKMKTNKNLYDVFNNRVKAASKRSTLYQFTSKLCNYLGLQSIPSEAQQLLDSLRPHEAKVLYTLSVEHIPLCMKAILHSKSKKSRRGGKRKC